MKIKSLILEMGNGIICIFI